MTQYNLYLPRGLQTVLYACTLVFTTLVFIVALLIIAKL